MTSIPKIQCTKMVAESGQWGVFHQYGCKNPVFVTRDGKPYCMIYDPEYRQKLADKRTERRDAERKVREDSRDREACIRYVFENIPTETIRSEGNKYKAAPEMYEALKAVKQLLGRRYIDAWHYLIPWTQAEDQIDLGQVVDQALAKARGDSYIKGGAPVPGRYRDRE